MIGIGTFAAIAALAGVHLFAGRLTLLPARYRAPLLAAGGGASLAYVMLRLLPKLAEKQATLSTSIAATNVPLIDHGAYLMALAGMIIYHLFSAKGTVAQPLGRLIPVAAHCAYSALIAYLVVHRLKLDLTYLGLIVVGLGALFLVSDYGFYKQDPARYDRRTRWLLAGSLVIGLGLGLSFEMSGQAVGFWFALLAGIMIMSTITEKLTAEDQRSSLAFIAGAVVFALLIAYLTHS